MPSAQRYYALAVHTRDGVGTTPTFTYHDIMCEYLERDGRSDEALELRSQQLATLAPSGLVHELCDCHLMRCRLMGRMGQLMENDIEEAKLVACELLKPEQYLEKVAQIQANNFDNWWGL